MRNLYDGQETLLRWACLETGAMIVPRSNDHFRRVPAVWEHRGEARESHPNRESAEPPICGSKPFVPIGTYRSVSPSVGPAPRPLWLALEAPVTFARSVALDFSLGRGLADRRKPGARCLGLVLPLRQDALSLWSDLVERCSSKPFVDG